MTFSRHDNNQASLVLFIWLNEKVDNKFAYRSRLACLLLVPCLLIARGHRAYGSWAACLLLGVMQVKCKVNAEPSSLELC